MNFDAANVVVATIAVLVSGFFSIIAYRAAIHQNRLTASTVASDWIRDLRAWASEAVDVLAEATYVCQKDDPEPTPNEAECLRNCRYRLSALIDRGRFLLPNEREREYGDHKPHAYRGLRHHALDSLVAAERVLGGDLGLLSFRDKKEALIGLRREFVSEIHSIIDPRSSNKKVAEMLRTANEERAKDSTLGGLLPDPSRKPVGADGALQVASRRKDAALAKTPAKSA